MSKGIRINEFKDCPASKREWCPWRHNCEKTFPNPDCPLPDWPEVSREQIRKLTILIQGGDSEWQRTQDLIAGFVCSIGVIVKEGEKDGE